MITTLTVIVVQRGTHETILNAAASFVGIAAGVPEPRADAPEGSLADCISYWNTETHMSKAEWLAASYHFQGRRLEILADQFSWRAAKV
jgi:hypothetical protein